MTAPRAAGRAGRAVRDYPSTLLDLLTRAVRPRCSTWVGLRLRGWKRVYTARFRVVAGARPIEAVDEEIANPAEHGPILEQRVRAALGDELCDTLLAMADFTYMANRDGSSPVFSASVQRVMVETLVLHDVIDPPTPTKQRAPMARERSLR